MSPTIAQQRTGEGAQGLVVRRRNQWGAKRAYTDARTVDFCTRLVFHITVTNPGNYLNNDRHAQGIEAIGIARFPSTGVSYNMLVMPNAAIYEAQPLGRRGAHTVNNFKRASCTTTGCPSRGQPLTAPNRDWNLNYNARAVAICQNVQHPVTVAQAQAVARIGAAWKRAGFVHRQARWHGHRCVSSKSCPGNAGWARMKMIHDLTESYTVNGLPGGTTPPTKGMLVMLGLKKGAKGAEVRVLQIILGYAGFPRTGGVQSVSAATYDTATSNAVLKMRKAMGSTATSGDTLDTYAYSQLFRALARAEAGQDGANATDAQVAAAVKAHLDANVGKFKGEKGDPPTVQQVADAAAAWFEANKDDLRGEDGRTPTEVTIDGVRITHKFAD